jgi:hypothetical protein
MINEVLSVVRDRLEGILQADFPQGECWVRLGHAGAPDGEPKDRIDKMIMSVVSLQPDASAAAFARPQPAGGDAYYRGYPALHLDVVFMVAANFTDSNYEAGLGLLSRVIAFFQQTPVLARESAPALPADLDKVVIEMVNLDLAQLGHLLSAAGVKYVPLVLYRIRRLPFAGSSAVALAPAVRAAGAGDPLGGPTG